VVPTGARWIGGSPLPLVDREHALATLGRAERPRADEAIRNLPGGLMTRAMRSPVRTPSAGAGEDFAAFGQVGGDLGVGETQGPDFVAIQQSEDFKQLRKRLRNFVFPMAAVFFCWYMTYVLVAAYDHSFMSRKVVGKINIGIVFGLLQFVSTILIMLLYRYFGKKVIDPRVEAIRARVGVDKE
jgi:uncharacterized membrane protein (DUF485 family)